MYYKKALDKPPYKNVLKVHTICHVVLAKII